MKFNKQLLVSAVAAATLSTASFAPVANAEVSASVSVASSYLWRGLDLGPGVPAVSGSLDYSVGGFYAGTWVSSGDTSGGTEYDLGAGYAGEAGIFSYDISVWNYLYPQGSSQEDTFGDLTELIIGLGLGPVSLTIFDNIATNGGDETYRYYALGAGAGDFSFTYGFHTGEDSTEFSHIDVSYAYNDNLSFTISQVVDDADDAVDDDLKMVVSYSLPIE